MNSNETTLKQTENMHRIFNIQREAQIKDPYPSLALRIDRIDRMIDMIVRNEASIIDAVMADFESRSPFTTRFTDIVPTLDNLKYVRKNLKKWMKPEKRNSKFPLGLIGAKSKVEHVPIGVVGNISPWNFPIALALSPIGEIFGAGNRCLLKPSELSQHSSDVMAEMIGASFDESELAVILGGPELSAEFSKLKFNHILFTGSTSVARLVAQAAAPNLIPLTLELGGKNPVIISETADLKLAAEKLIWSKTVNGGQICLSPDTVYIPEKSVEGFVTACKDSLKKLHPNVKQDPEYTHAISQRHADRINDIATDAKEKGARVIPLSDEVGEGRKILPSLILNPGPECRVTQEETFGPLLTVVSYSQLQNVVNEINEKPKPLGLYYFGKNQEEIDKLTYETSSGGMVVNDLFAHSNQEDLPFGGVGDSGMGSYHGYDGFKNFSHAKAFYTQSNLDPFKMLRPPYSIKVMDSFKKQVKR
ncbi:aldehyde dehydrogenase family protein [Paraglaciecola sp. 20A4]|uniref:aldehyde dehydrogenase family protein n=1 Tax=Paraglaciecola sp. 20A4 TaxID=2687288 RepID=UPI001409B486|nr:aldehyde dehydrogenase family protein [Paraglaciecola sp. 20A4]